MSSRQDVNLFLQDHDLKEDGARMRQFIEFVKCQNPEFDGDPVQLTLEELSSVGPHITQLYNEFSTEQSDELTDSKYQAVSSTSDDEGNYQDELADQVLPLKGALKLQNSRLSGDEDCSETPMLPPERKVAHLFDVGEANTPCCELSKQKHQSSECSFDNDPGR